MTIQVNNALSGVNWEALLQQVDSLGKASGTGEKPVLNFTTTAADGTPRTVQVNIPDDLETPATVDQAAIDSLCGKLAANPDFGVSTEQVQQLHTQLGNVLKSDGVSDSFCALPGSSNVMFDLYKLMALLVEVAQKQRDSARQLRESESVQEQTAILNQAEEQRTDAYASMISSLVCCGIQVAAMGISMGVEMKSFHTQMETVRTSGVESARENLATLQTAETLEGAKTQFQTTREKVGTSASLDVDLSFNKEPTDAHKAAMDAKKPLDDDIVQRATLRSGNKLPAAKLEEHPALKTAQERVDAFEKAQKLEAKGEQKLSPAEASQLKDLHAKLDDYATEKAGKGLLEANAEVFGDDAKAEASSVETANKIDQKIERMKALAAREAAPKEAVAQEEAPTQKKAAPQEEASAPKKAVPEDPASKAAPAAKKDAPAEDPAQDPKKVPAGGGDAPAKASEEAPAGQGLCDAEKKELAELRKEIYGSAKESAKADLKQARADALEEVEKSIKTHQESFDKARATANEKINAALKPYEEAYDAALGARASAAPDTPPKEIERLDGELEAAGKKLQYARARAAEMRFEITTPEERQVLIEQAKARVTTAQDNLHGDLTYVKAGNAMHRAESFISLANTIGGCIQGLIQHGAALGQANITAEGGAQKKKEEEMDELKDLFNQAGDLVKSVIQLMAAVGNAESQSMRDAIQA